MITWWSRVLALPLLLAVQGGPIDLFGGESALERFEKFLFLGDDRCITSVFVAGKKVV
jgi:hypothetical protein